MAINLSSRGCELIIGSQDWTNWIDASSGIQIGYPEYQMGIGLMPVSGTITLSFSIYDTNLPSNPNYFLNPSQWKRGQTVTIRIKNSAGTLTYLPCSGQLLYLLKPTQRPNRDINGIATLQLDVGCRLALDDFPPEPNKNIAGVVAGTSTNRNTIIGNILDYISVPHSISSLPYPIDYPLPKTDGNWISFAGAIADSAGYYLRCNSAGTVEAIPISIEPETAIETYIVGADEKLWDSIGDTSEQPLEKLIVSGVKQNVLSVGSATQIINERLPLSQISTAVGFEGNVNLAPSKRTTKTSTLVSSTIFVTQENIEEPLCRVSTFAAYEDDVNLVPSKETKNTYLLANGIVYQQIEQLREPLCQVSTASVHEGFVNLVPSKRSTYTWTKTGDKIWTKSTSVLESLNRVSNAAVHEGIVTLVPSSTFADDKDTIGPPTSFGDASLNTITEENLTATVFAVQLATDPFREREKSIDVPYAMTLGQLSSYGDRFNKLLTGRSLGYQFSGALTDIAMGSTFYPFAPVAVQEGALLYYARLDAVEYALNQTECYVLWNGIITGTAPTSAPTTITRPIAIPFGVVDIEMISFGTVLNDSIFLDDIEMISFGTAWITQIITDPIEMISFGTAIVSGSAPSGLIAKTVAYFPCEEATGNRASVNGDAFTLSNSGSALVNSVTGVVGDGFTGATSAYGAFVVFNPTSGLAESTLSLNSVAFIGYAFAFKFTTSPSGTPVLFGNDAGSGDRQLVLQYNSGYLEVVVTDNTSTQYTLTYSTDMASLDPSNVTDWNLVIFTVDVTAGVIALQVNDMAIETTSCPTSGFAAWTTIGFEYIDMEDDEILIFDTPLDTTDRNTLWNSGNFNTYTSW
jgi:hypothetical protein